jgi:hypothetical protein
MELLTPEEIVNSFKIALGDSFVGGSVYECEVAVKKNKFRSLWVDVKKSAFRDAVEHICHLQKYPHLAIISSSDLGAEDLLWPSPGGVEPGVAGKAAQE